MAGGVERPRCSYCKDVLGVYEPIVAVGADDLPRATSWLVEGNRWPQGTVFHKECFEHSRDAHDES